MISKVATKHWEPQLKQGVIRSIQNSRQCGVLDCFLMSTLQSLPRSTKGTDLLNKSLKHTEEGDFLVTFKNVSKFAPKSKNKEKSKSYEIKNNEINQFMFSINSDATKSVELAYKKLYEDTKVKTGNFLSKLGRLVYREKPPLNYGFASKFMELFTGVKPINLYDSSYNSIRKSNKKKKVIKEFLDSTAESNKKFSLVAGSVHFPKEKKKVLHSHYFTIENINSSEKTISLIDPRRSHERLKLTYDEFMTNFRSICGYKD